MNCLGKCACPPTFLFAQPRRRERLSKESVSFQMLTNCVWSSEMKLEFGDTSCEWHTVVRALTSCDINSHDT